MNTRASEWITKLKYRGDKVEKESALTTHKAREQLWNPGNPLDWWNSHVVLVDSLSQGALFIIKTEQP